jgi:hypothetical protein
VTALVLDKKVRREMGWLLMLYSPANSLKEAAALAF